jgi:hypothetical protein
LFVFDQVQQLASHRFEQPVRKQHFFLQFEKQRRMEQPSFVSLQPSMTVGERPLLTRHKEAWRETTNVKLCSSTVASPSSVQTIRSSERSTDGDALES